MSPRKNLWYGAVAVAGVLLLASQSYRVADASATAAREKIGASTLQARDTLCTHDETSFYHGCGDFINPNAVKAVRVTVTYQDGRTDTLVSGAKTDAIFLSKQAAQNFLVRYYRNTQQTKKLADLNALLRRATVR